MDDKRLKGEYKKVRLPFYVLKAIEKTAKEVFGEDINLWIFGSRVNLNAKGGDIDLYIETKEGFNAEKVIRFLAKLDLKIGERKVDVIVRKFGSKEEIALEAKTKGVKLI